MKFYIALRYRYNFMMLKKGIISLSLQCQYVIGLYRDENPTKNRCRHNIACPLGRLRCEICSKLTIKTYFAPFSSVSIVDFQQENNGRVGSFRD